MLTKFCAIVFLALAISPCTAPFQTFDPDKATVIVAFSHEDVQGSLVAAKPARLMIAPPANLAVAYIPPVALVPQFVPPISCFRHDSLRLTVLRV